MYDDNDYIQMDESFDPENPTCSNTMPCWTDLAICVQMYKLQEQSETLGKIISKPQVIAITGVQNLKSETGNTWKERLTTLLFEACIPYFWTIDLEDNHADPNLAYIYFFNSATKTKARELLTHFLQTTYQNNVCILQLGKFTYLNNHADPNLTYILFLNSATKTKARDLLTHFFYRPPIKITCVVYNSVNLCFFNFQKTPQLLNETIRFSSNDNT
jgi:hypothetical protein